MLTRLSSDPRGAVDALPDHVGVAVVPGVLVDHVVHHQSQRHLLLPARVPRRHVQGLRRALDAALPEQFARAIFAYLPNVLAAILILVLGAVLARFLARSVLITPSVPSIPLPISDKLGQCFAMTSEVGSR